MSPLPPGSTASMMPGILCRNTRMAWPATPKTLGIDCGLPMTKGTPPSQTSVVLSRQLIVLNPPPLPPKQ